MVNYIDVVMQGYALCEYIKQRQIPYVNNGMTLAGMDCQGLCEYLLIEAGMDKQTVNLKGSNHHWRESLKWKGTPEECVKLFGKIPDGAWLFIHEPQEHPNYRDGQGDLVHVGQYLDFDLAVHASSSRGCVVESSFKGKSINGGWNRVGLCKWIQYHKDVEAKLGNFVEDPDSDLTIPDWGDEDDGNWQSETDGPSTPPPVVRPPATPQFASVWAVSGTNVKMRKTPSKAETLYWNVPIGARVQVISQSNGWTKIKYNGKTAYMMSEFLIAE